MSRHYHLPAPPERPDSLPSGTHGRVERVVAAAVRHVVERAAAASRERASVQPVAVRPAPLERYAIGRLRAGGARYDVPSYDAHGRAVALPLHQPATPVVADAGHPAAVAATPTSAATSTPAGGVAGAARPMAAGGSPGSGSAADTAATAGHQAGSGSPGGAPVVTGTTHPVAPAGGHLWAAVGSGALAGPGGRAGPPAEPLLTAGGPLERRVADFKKLVLAVAVQRLYGNRNNLARWADLIDRVIPAPVLGGVGLVQSGGTFAYQNLQEVHDPARRELMAGQAVGHYRACTGCHLSTWVHNTQAERFVPFSREWLSPNEQRATGGYRPAQGGDEAMLNELLPDPAALPAIVAAARPILAALGPDGYQVLPDSILGNLENSSVAQLRADIHDAIVERSAGYLELIGRIRHGEMGYEHFGPIIRDLLPAADRDVRAAIQEEMDRHAFWARVEAVVVGVLTIALLLMVVALPPTALVLASTGALETGLAAYGMVRGPQMMTIGHDYGLAIGAHDVLSPQQQQAGAMMVLGGFVSTVMAPLGVVSGASRMASGLARMGGATRLLGLTAGQTVQRGAYLLTVGEDGALIVTSVERPDVIIIVRDDVATAYQSTGTGLRVIDSRPVAPGAGGAVRTGGVAGPEAAVPPHVLPAGPQPRGLLAPGSPGAGTGAGSRPLIGQGASLDALASLAGEDAEAAHALWNRYRDMPDIEIFRRVEASDATAEAVLRQRYPDAEEALRRVLGSDYRPPHSAVATVTRGGRAVLRQNLASGNMTPAERALGWPRSSLATHTEARAVHTIELQRGDVLSLTGQYDPCSSCIGAMRAAAARTGATIIYWWPGGMRTFRP